MIRLEGSRAYGALHRKLEDLHLGGETMRDMVVLTPKGSPWNERRDIKRGTSLPLKRTQSSPIDRSRDHLGVVNGSYNGTHVEHGQKGYEKECSPSGLKAKGSLCRSIKGEGGYFWKSRNLLIRVLITFMAACFLAAGLMQGSIMMVLKHTDFLTVPEGDLSTGSDSSVKTSSNSVTEGSSHCERAVFLETLKLMERLPKKPTFQELSTLGRFSRRPPRLAMICPNLGRLPDSLYFITVARGLQWLNYDLELYAREDGHLRSAWEDIGVRVFLVPDDEMENSKVDWSRYEGVIALSLAAKKLLESLSQDPFGDITVIWVIQENIVLDQVAGFNSSKELNLVLDSWQEVFNRSSVVVFPNYYLPMIYSELFYSKNFFVIPGSPWDVWEAEQYMITHRRQDARARFAVSSSDFAIVVVGSPCVYTGSWMEHALIMKAVSSLLSVSSSEDPPLGPVKVFVLGHSNSTSAYKETLQVISHHVGLPSGLLQHVGIDDDINGLLWTADVVIYASVLEEHAFPPVLVRAMTFERPVIAPDITAIRKHIVDGHNGFLYSPGDEEDLGRVLVDVRSNSEHSCKVAAEGKSLARDMLGRDSVLQYGRLLEKLLDFPEDAHLPRLTDEIQALISQGWRWDLIGEMASVVENTTTKDLLYLRAETYLEPLGTDWNNNNNDSVDTSLENFDWLEEKDHEQEREAFASEQEERVEEEELMDRLEAIHTSFEDVSKYVKKTETRMQKEDHREIDNLELERVGQPIIIYETFRGSGAWSFLHREHLLYRGLSLSTKGKRPDADDIDGQARLPLLNESYYRDILCEFGGFFAMANFIDRVHANIWIGFQPWRAASQKVALTPIAEASLLHAVALNLDGDALYFWSQSDSQLPDDFWAMCDAVNGGNCRNVFRETWKQMYGLPPTWNRLPPMPSNSGTWSSRHCWALHTTSFLEFVRFSRIFVDALDSQHYVEHHDGGTCCLSRSKAEGQHCYCRLLEGLINVWAYHSARKMIYLDPETGAMKEQHSIESRKGTTWAKYFQRDLLKNMDEDLAEEYDEDRPKRRSIWPLTGEVFWQGSLDKERRARYRAKLEKKRRQLERQARLTKYKQKPIGGKVSKSEARLGIV
ncbi:hypothetical protein R1sor_009890 [Riccia sorocarpa]|uniref:Glycosyl transferase family 1 domain-containing protein n=1 Tax=Riccia sorocarpa TaxID=122646 RepID=A0ABD3HYD8_9MARC